MVSDAANVEGMRFPSETHQKYVKYLVDVCTANHITCAIKGSVACGTAKRYSDVDVLLLGGTLSTCIDRIIEYDTPLMVNLTERPKGLLMITYKNGLCAELDCRKTVTREEMQTAILLHDSEVVYTDGEVKRLSVSSIHIATNPIHRYLRLLYKALLKYLCEKKSDAEDLLEELNAFSAELRIQSSNLEREFPENADEIYRHIKEKYPIEAELDDEIRWLIGKMVYV